MANEVVKITDQNGVDHPIKDAIAQAGIIANTKLIKDTVGFSGKNKAVPPLSKSEAGGVFTVNSDGSVAVSGIPTAVSQLWYIFPLTAGKYILSGIGNAQNVQWSSITLKKNGSNIPSQPTYAETADDITLDLSSYDFDQIAFSIKRINNNQAMSGTVYTMLRDADILDSTYEPYFGSTAFPRSEQAVLGAKNLMPWPYYNANGSEYGVTWVTNDDGTVTVSTPNGPSTGQANIHLIRPQNFPSWLLNVPLKLSGCPSGGDSLKYEMSTYLYDGTNTAHDYGDGNVPFMFTSAGEKQLSITIRPNVTISTPITFKPMITLASDTECDYEHFVFPAMTNRELTNIANDFYANDMIGYIKTAVIKSANTTADQISAIEAFIASDSNYAVRNFVTANVNGQTNGVGMMYKYSASYAGFFYTSYLTDKLIIGRLYDGTWSTREV